MNLNTDTLELSWNIQFSGMSSDVVGMHFHGPARVRETAGVIVSIGDISGLRSPSAGSATVTADQATEIMSGQWYVNIHTENNGPGEIRGQVIPDTATSFEFTITSEQETPSPDLGDATPGGRANVILDTDTLELSWNIIFSDLSSNAVGMHFHGPAQTGETASVIVSIGDISGLQSPSVGSATITQAQADEITGGLWYVNIHTENNGPGEIRGQVEEEDSLIIGGSGLVVANNIVHPNGNVYDQVLLQGQTVTVRAHSGQITRTSFIDENDDLVQVEMTGSGQLTISIDPVIISGPVFPVNYNQDIAYVKGRPSIRITGAASDTFFNIFSVGSINVVNQGLIKDEVTYDAKADLSLLNITGDSIGGILAGNATFSSDNGGVGIFAQDVTVVSVVRIGDIDAQGGADPLLVFGSGSSFEPLEVKGGDLVQTNAAAIIIEGFSSIDSGEGVNSDFTSLPTVNSFDTSFVDQSGESVETTITFDEQ